MFTYILQDQNGQINSTTSISAGLDYPGIGPIHSYLHKIKRVIFDNVNDDEALEAAFRLTRLEGIVPALESAHALAWLGKYRFRKNDVVVVTISGRGDKDMDTYINYMEEPDSLTTRLDPPTPPRGG
jgi:tryptophan synthase beta chain